MELKVTKARIAAVATLTIYSALLVLLLSQAGHWYKSATLRTTITNTNTSSGIGIIKTNFSTLKVTPPPPCTARLLTDHSKTNESDANSNGWIKTDGSTNNKKSWHWQWQLSSNVQKSCQMPNNKDNNDTNYTLIPLQSTPQDIQNALTGKWIVMVGDSSIRMLHDYLVGRWFGNYTHWPQGMTNHGPREHARSCRQFVEDCHYDVFYQGARVTFVWLSLHISQKELKEIMDRTIGTPDMVIAQHGYWESRNQLAEYNPKAKDMDPKQRNDACRRNAEQVVTTITEWTKIQEMKGIYPHAYHHGSKKVWFSSFNYNFFVKYDNVTDGRIYDGTKKANELGWDILDRTILVNPDTGEQEGPHPMNEVLEVQLEMLLLLIQNL